MQPIRNTLSALFAMFLVGTVHAVRIVQFNIQELDSVKIQSEQLASPQLVSAKNILNKLQPDILSLNEIQYDLPNVPNKNYTSFGQNIAFISHELLDDSLLNHIFFPANTGQNAMRDQQDEYIRRPKEQERYEFCDPVNFGMFPAQYSTGALTRFTILSVKQFNTIEWKDFNPSIDLSLYKDEHSHSLPENMPLFDKNFTDATLLIEGHKVHLLLLHAVPAYSFNNPRSSNYARNRDQLLFLKWYLGESVFVDTKNIMITPLNKGTRFIAVGDWNADINNPTENAEVLKSLGKIYHYAVDQHIPTHRGTNLLQDEFVSHIDYILLSNDIGVKQSGVFAPPAHIKKLGCDDETANEDGFILVKLKEANQQCNYLIEENYYHSKMVSDHSAVWADIYFK